MKSTPEIFLLVRLSPELIPTNNKSQKNFWSSDQILGFQKILLNFSYFDIKNSWNFFRNLSSKHQKIRPNFFGFFLESLSVQHFQKIGVDIFLLEALSPDLNFTYLLDIMLKFWKNIRQKIKSATQFFFNHWSQNSRLLLWDWPVIYFNLFY